MIKAVVIGALLALPVSNALAQEDLPLDCANAQTQADMNQCSYLDFEKADEALNAVYKRAMKSAQAADKQAAATWAHGGLRTAHAEAAFVGSLGDFLLSEEASCSVLL